MILKYIKANGVYYYPQKAGIKDKNKTFGNCPVCIIKKLLFRRWQIDYYDDIIQYNMQGHYTIGDEDKPNQRLILYPSGIEEIRFDY